MTLLVPLNDNPTNIPLVKLKLPHAKDNHPVASLTGVVCAVHVIPLGLVMIRDVDVASLKELIQQNRFKTLLQTTLE
jgi:hypothetical protein